MKQILIINGHPEMRSLCTEMAMSYQKGAEASGASCKLVHLSKMNFDPLRHLDYMQLHKLEPDLVEIQKTLKMQTIWYWYILIGGELTLLY